MRTMSGSTVRESTKDGMSTRTRFRPGFSVNDTYWRMGMPGQSSEPASTVRVATQKFGTE
jgi:hypothetical protein